MCGIVGIVGVEPAAPRLVDALKRLEYRGYDSAGVATLVDGRIERRRAEGKLVNLEERLKASPLGGLVGIGHTRWATHGRPNETNAHPHATDRVAIVHNGIIENYLELKEELAREQRRFETETDTEVVAHLVTSLLDRGLKPSQAAAQAFGRLEGAFAIVILFKDDPGLLIGVRKGPPLAVGYGGGEMYVGSDALALAPFTDRIQYLEDGDWVEVRGDGAVVHDASGAIVDRPIRQTAQSGALIGKGEYRHFMLKEIHEQPAVIGDTVRSYVDPQTRSVTLPELPFDWAAIPRITIVACGTASLAGLVGKYWFEELARLPVEWDVASEFRYREAPMPPGGVALVVSQSGETADTLAALRYCKASGQHTVAIVNVAGSTIAREADAVLLTLAGPEIGVASTKAFTTQLTLIAALAIAAARRRGTIDAAREACLVDALTEVPGKIADFLNHADRLVAIAEHMVTARDVLYLGRGTGFPMALEGALKLKEISYIHAEGYAAGEMKHGPIALIDDQVPVIVIAPPDHVFEKTWSNLQEVMARGGRVILITGAAGAAKAEGSSIEVIAMPEVDPFAAPILYAVPVQLLAYHVAVAKGTDVDQPRNLAKSVTVE